MYDIQEDPYEVRNLARSMNPDHQRVLEEMRRELDRWIEETNDQGRFPERPEVVEYWKTEMLKLHGEYLE